MLDLDAALRSAVRQTYTAIAEAPAAEHPIPVGRALALGVGYPEELLARLPAAAVEAFAGVSNVSLFAELSPGQTVLDLGCGAGLDSLIAGERVGPDGRVVGVDFSASMLARARQAAEESGTAQVRLCLADSERLPFRTGSIDAALVNGIFNLNPGREAIFRELARVVRPGGAVYAAELILKEALPEAERRDPASWFA
jgi:arsenite methyltransferase